MEMHLFDVFPELEKYYDPTYVSKDELKETLNIENNEDIL